MTLPVAPIWEPGWYALPWAKVPVHWFETRSHSLSVWSLCDQVVAAEYQPLIPAAGRHCKLCERALAKREAKK